MASYYYISICDARGDLLKSPARQGLWAEGHTEGHTVVPGVRPELHDCGDDLLIDKKNNVHVGSGFN